ncbi:protein archease isoform X1 [Ambystoma mexicanum]|uniref:protein archease isoform X1 n=1 Tax=Ambystoma mexicanum TaxID=8296 RepID=UPI0037E9223C
MAQDKGSSTPGSKLFRCCPGCGLQNVFKEDDHSRCLYCLHEDKTHVEKDCAFCKNLSERTKQDRISRLAAWLEKGTAGEKAKKKSERASKSCEGALATGAQQKAKHRESTGTGIAERSGSSVAKQGATSPARSTTSQRSGSGKRKSEKPVRPLERTWSISKGERGAVPPPKAKAQDAPKVVRALIHPAKASTEVVAATLAKPAETTPVETLAGPRVSLPPRRDSSFQPIAKTPVKPLAEKEGGGAVDITDSESASEEELVETEKGLNERSIGLNERSIGLNERLEKVRSQGAGFEKVRSQGAVPADVIKDSDDDDEQGPVERPPRQSQPLPEPQDSSAAFLLAIQSLCTEIRTRLPRTPTEDPEPGPSGSPPNKRRRVHPALPFVPARQVDHSSPSPDPREDTATDTATGTDDDCGDDTADIPSKPPLRASPADEIGSFHAMITRASDLFQLCPEEQKKEGFLYQRREAKRKTVLAVPLLDDIWEEGLAVLKNPSTTPAKRDRYEKKYQVPDAAPLCLRAQPTPDSVVSAAAKKKAAGAAASTSTSPPDSEGKKLDSMGRRVISSAATTIKAANALAIVARYDRELWFTIAPLLNFLPDDKRAEALEILQEGEVASDHAITAATDIADTGFRQLGNGVCLRRRGWLKATDFRQDVQTRVLDMAFDGNNLFGKAVDESLQAIKTDSETARALGVLPAALSELRRQTGCLQRIQRWFLHLPPGGPLLFPGGLQRLRQARGFPPPLPRRPRRQGRLQARLTRRGCRAPTDKNGSTTLFSTAVFGLWG